MTHSDFLPAPRPRLADLKGCEDWLARATLADPRQACSALLALLEEIEDAPPRHAAYLQILEHLRQPLVLAQAEHAKRFAGKPLPLGHVERAAFAQATDLWAAAQRAYARLWRAALNGRHPELKPSFALLAQRVLACTAELAGAHFLARREAHDEHWQALHETWALAEARGVAAASVAELRFESSPAAAYGAALLLHLARPHELALRELYWARKWIAYWSRKVELRRERPAEDGYVVDLAGGGAPAWAGTAGSAATLRHVDLSRVRRSVMKRLRKLEEGVEPQALGLGRDCPPQAASDLLKALAHAWLEAPAPQSARSAAPSPVEIACGFEAIQGVLGGRPAAAGAGQPSYSYREAEQLHTFQRAAESAAKPDSRERRLETWEMLSESAAEFRLHRNAPGANLSHRQLVALRPRGARHFILCEVRWLFEGASQSVTIGARALQGLAQAGTVRRDAGDAKGAQSAAGALVLQVGQGLPPSLVLPVGWYQSGRELELGLAGGTQRIRLFGLLGRGFDFERANFTAA